MNVRMWLHAATQRNLAALRDDGVRTVGPETGDMACGEYGPGRMAEPEAIADAAEAMLAEDPQKLALEAVAFALTTPDPGGWLPQSVTRTLRGMRALVTSGPTHEPIDPVRYIANRSSGRQGHAIAEALAARGAAVTLVSGPVAISDPPGVTVVRVETAEEMLAAASAALPADVAVFAAAVADWRAAETASAKIKKGPGDPPALALVRNPDVLATLAKGPDRPRLVVGFAAETDHLGLNARAKLAAKGADWIVANDVSASSGVAGGVMGGARNAVRLFTRTGDRLVEERWPEMDKRAVAAHLAARVAAALGGEDLPLPAGAERREEDAP